MCRVLCASFALAAALAAVERASATPSGGVEVCPENGVRWLAPITFPGMGVARPELVVGERGVFASGFAPALRMRSGVARLGPSLSDLGAPPDARDFFDPVLRVDRAGVLHAVWGEGGEVLAAGASERSIVDHLRAERVMYARFERGRWSRAEEVFRAPIVRWTRSSFSRLEEDSYQRLHLFFTAERSSRQILVHIRRDAGRWHVTEWDEDTFRKHDRAAGEHATIPLSSGGYPRMAFGPGARVYLAFIMAAHVPGGTDAERPDANSVWVRRSEDAGRTWGRAVLVSRSGALEAHEPQIVVSGGDTLHVLWQKDLAAARGRVGPGQEAIWHAVSADGGQTWGAPNELRPAGPHPLRLLRAEARADGGLIVAFLSPSRDFPANRPAGQIFYAEWRPSGWSAVRPLRPELEVMDFDLALDDADRVHLLWSHIVRPAAGAPVRRPLHYAIGRLCETG